MKMPEMERKVFIFEYIRDAKEPVSPGMIQCAVEKAQGESISRGCIYNDLKFLLGVEPNLRKGRYKDGQTAYYFLFDYRSWA